MSRNIFCVLVLLMMCSGGALGQQDYSSEYRSVPTWPKSGSVSESSSDNYVYLDEGSTQMVLSYPEDLGESEYKRDSSLRRVQRFDLNNQVDAMFSVKVEAIGPEFIYSYHISNSKKAKKAINTFLMPLPVFDSRDTSIAVPNFWASAAYPSEINAVKHAIGKTSGIVLSWYSVDFDASVIAPGSDLDGFQITTARKPGFTLAYVQGGLRPSLSSDIPSAVLEQTIPVLQVEHNSQNVIVLAPKFSADTPLQDIADDFLSGINRMVQAGQLDGNSLAVQEALNVLQSYTNDKESSLTFSADPQVGLEAEVISALKLSLNIQ